MEKFTIGKFASNKFAVNHYLFPVLQVNDGE